MTKTGQTKNEILNLIATGNKTLSEISHQLNLAPSTVSQHLQELKDSGAISEVDNPYIKKWKYYQLNPEFNYTAHNYDIRHAITPNKIPRPLYYLAFVLIIASVGYFAFSYLGHSVSSGQNSIPLMLTDPPIVPNGTTALYINYSSVGVHLAGNVSTPWVYSTGSGTVDLMSLVNVSQVIGNVRVSNNSAIDAATFNITSAWIVINGTTYNVAVPSSKLTAHVTEGTVNGSSSILIDMSPIVTTVYTQNSSIFVMVPSLKAVAVSGTGKAGSAKGLNIGTNFNLLASDKQKLGLNRPNITITGASIVQQNDSTYIQVTVQNNGNSSVDIRNLLVMGKESPTIGINESCAIGANSTRAAAPWCGLLAGGKRMDATHAYGGREGFDAQNLGIVSGLPVSTAITAGSNAGGHAQISGSGAGTSGYTHGNYNSSYGSGASAAGYAHRSYNYSYGNYTGRAPPALNSSAAGRFGGRVNESIPFPPQKGPIRVSLPFSGQFNGTVSTNQTFNYSAMHGPSAGIHILLPPNWQQGNYTENLTSELNATAVYGIMVPRSTNNTLKIGQQVMSSANMLRALNFIVQQNGTLSLQEGMYLPNNGGYSGQMPTPAAQMQQNVSTGYVITAGQSATFTYSAKVAFPGNLSISLVPGSKYNITLIGEDGAYTSVSVNAS